MKKTVLRFSKRAIAEFPGLRKNKRHILEIEFFSFFDFEKF
ncbi:hypothetical protein LSS_10248 [Leptospira santarosai serovar Shermani str. LT 821]|uniref:Uncharacterized protein n=1 Tax=Leptospira santarosai serovar Shermani str. LT 821 TaxID=758847 RepID=K8Y197_9LEPT|nr:hypothetical protein LSS_10248 [Leptospira santarosai serovar Shermani str. LT 821]